MTETELYFISKLPKSYSTSPLNKQDERLGRGKCERCSVMVNHLKDLQEIAHDFNEIGVVSDDLKEKSIQG
jgi:hypothetical protein